uniref:Putative secreted protein n=1 Tax=Anopheles triannulatus TaxID=58253 RepID=A0A2M4B6M5_9DIPT
MKLKYRSSLRLFVIVISRRSLCLRAPVVTFFSRCASSDAPSDRTGSRRHSCKRGKCTVVPRCAHECAAADAAHRRSSSGSACTSAVARPHGAACGSGGSRYC